MKSQTEPDTACADDEHPHQPDGQPHLTDQRRRSRSANSPAQSEHQDEVEHQVHREGDDGGHQRGASVLEPAQHPSDGHGGEHGRHSPSGDLQVLGSELGGLSLSAEEPGCRHVEDDDEQSHDDSDEQREPQPVHSCSGGPGPIPSTHPARRGRRRRIGQEDEQPGGREQRRAGNTEAGQLRGAHVSDDGRVGHEEQRLGHQGQEGRDREIENQPVEGFSVVDRCVLHDGELTSP